MKEWRAFELGTGFAVDRLMFFRWLIIGLLAIVQLSTAQARTCSSLFDNRPYPEKVLTFSQSIAQTSYQSVKDKLVAAKAFTRRNRGYAILSATMVGSAAVTTYLTGSLPKEFQFLSQLVGQISTIGIYVFGAPIWDPLSSSLRRAAFGVSPTTESSSQGVERLDDMWRVTQSTYSINSQMSRNLINAFITAVRQNFYEAYRAMNSNDPQYAISQIAEAAVRLKMLFKDISPDDPSVALAVRSAFTSHVSVTPAVIEGVAKRIREFDQDEAGSEFYEKLLKAWFQQTTEDGPVSNER